MRSVLLLAAAALALVAAPAATAATSYPGTVLADSPSHYFRFNDAAGKPAANAAYASHYGVVKPGVFANGAPAVLDGTSFEFGGGVVAVSGSAAGAVYRSRSISVEAWVKPTWLGGRQVVAGNEPLPGSPEAGYALRIDPDGAFRFHIGRPGASLAAAVGGRAAIGRWSHVVGTHDGSVLRIYVDGALAGRSAGTASITTSQAFGFGRVVPDGGADHFNGYMDEAAVYGYALPEARVLAHANVGVHGSEVAPAPEPEPEPEPEPTPEPTPEAGIATAAAAPEPEPEPKDMTAPVVEADAGGTTGHDGWFTSDITITFTVTDEESATTTDGCDAVTVTEDTAGVTHTCVATSEGGRTERSITVRRDATAPALTVSHAADGLAGWNVTDGVTLDLRAADATSGADAAQATCSTGRVVRGEGVHAVECTVVDAAGNRSAVATDTVRIDTIAPRVAHAGAGTYELDDAIALTCAASDDGSGLATDTCAGFAGTGADLGAGSHAFAASATDVAGNRARADATVIIEVTTDGLAALIAAYCDQENKADDLIKKLRRGDVDQVRKQIASQSGKSFTVAEADELLALIDRL